uniref:Uncharacterized protein n=1 Tax=Megaselia scalaris TaxID=36166 RepID=T1GHG1_MEGSC
MGGDCLENFILTTIPLENDSSDTLTFLFCLTLKAGFGDFYHDRTYSEQSLVRISTTFSTFF